MTLGRGRIAEIGGRIVVQVPARIAIAVPQLTLSGILSSSRKSRRKPSQLSVAPLGPFFSHHDAKLTAEETSVAGAKRAKAPRSGTIQYGYCTPCMVCTCGLVETAPACHGLGNRGLMWGPPKTAISHGFNPQILVRIQESLRASTSPTKLSL